MNKRRLGRFEIYLGDLRRWETEMLPIMGNFVIVESRYHYDRDVTEFMGYSPLFDEIAKGECAPFYDIEVAMFPDAPAVIKAIRNPIK